MKYLLDTHAFLWFINGDSKISLKARSAIERPGNIKYISIASFWEIAIKLSIGKLELDMPFLELKSHIMNNGFEILPLLFEHTFELTKMNLFHKDPFDRIIIAQAVIEKLIIIGKDSNFGRYDIKMLW